MRERTDALDSLGNTTAATGKGFAIGSAALTAMALIAAFVSEVNNLDPTFVFDLSILNPPVLVGLFIGAMLAVSVLLFDHERGGARGAEHRGGGTPAVP